MTLSSRHPSRLLPAALVMVSCAPHTRFVTTPVPDLVNRPITQVTVVGVVGFRGLPIGAGTEAECALLLAEAFRTRNAVLTVPHPADDRALLEQAGLGFAWATLADTWLETGIADAVLLRDMADAVGAEALLGGVVVGVEETTTVSYSSVTDEETGERLTEASWRVVRVVAVRLWLFDTRDGDLLWEAAAASTTFGPAPVPLADAVARAIRNLATRLPRLAPQPVQ